MELSQEVVNIDASETEPHNHDNNDQVQKMAASAPQETSKKSKKDSKKEDKNVEQFMKSLNLVHNVDEKLSIVSKKYTQTAEENKKLLFYIKQVDKRDALLTKEREHLQQECNKAILVKSKLENLCRELQKQNKAIKEESLLKIREEEERRKETQAKFQNTLTEITTLLQQNNEKNTKLRDDNNSMTEKFKSMVSQYQLREQQVEKMAKQMALESELAEAKLQKCKLEHQADRERLVADMEQLKLSSAQYKAKILELQSVETALKSQLAIYTDKYDEFQCALVKSNEVFGGFKEQMEMMSKKIKKLEKESLSWKKRWETSQKALLDMCGERQTSEERAAATTRQLQHMQGLCRTLQAERTALLTTLKENNIERPPVPVLPPVAPAPPAPAPTASDNKMDTMVANCAQLRQSLAHLQNQLNVLTTNNEGAKEEPPKPEKQKKSKSKKNKADKQDPVTEGTAADSNIGQETAPQSELNSEIEVSTDKTAANDLDKQKTEENRETVESLVEAIDTANVEIDNLNINKEKAQLVKQTKDKLNAIEAMLPETAPNNLNPTNGDVVPSVGSTASDEVSHLEEVKAITNKAA